MNGIYHKTSYTLQNECFWKHLNYSHLVSQFIIYKTLQAQHKHARAGFYNLTNHIRFSDAGGPWSRTVRLWDVARADISL